MRVGELIPLGEWLPDLPDYLNPGATVIKNAIPGKKSYLPIGSLQAFTSAASAAILSGTAVKDDAGNSADFAGSAGDLYKLSTANAWAVVSKALGYNTADTDTWNWAKWGEQVLATNFAEAIQEYTLGTSSLFADLAAGAPQARYITVVGDFVMVGNTFDATDGSVPYRVRWSAIGDPTDWTVSATTQSDYQNLDSAFGDVRGVVGGVYGAAFQEKAISRITYVGSPSVFSFDRVETARGAFIPDITTLGQTSFYIAEDGFYAFTYDRSDPIGEGKVDKTFFADLNVAYTHRVRGAIDPINKLIIWAYPSNSSIAGNPDKLLIYSWTYNWWGCAEVDCETLVQFISLGYTLDGLDTVTTDIDTLSPSLDSKVWQGGDLSLAAFDADHKLSTFSGTALSATLETGEFQVFDGYKSLISRARPIVDNAATMQAGVRNTDQDSVTWSSVKSQNASGNCTLRSNGFRHRLRINTNGDFTHAQGVELLEAVKTGRR